MSSRKRYRTPAFCRLGLIDLEPVKGIRGQDHRRLRGQMPFARHACPPAFRRQHAEAHPRPRHGARPRPWCSPTSRPAGSTWARSTMFMSSFSRRAGAGRQSCSSPKISMNFCPFPTGLRSCIGDGYLPSIARADVSIHDLGPDDGRPWHGWRRSPRCGLNRASSGPLPSFIASILPLPLLLAWFFGGAGGHGGRLAVFGLLAHRQGRRRLAIRVLRNPDPRDASDFDRPCRRRRFPRQAVEHRRRSPALYRRGHDGRARHRPPAFAAPLLIPLLMVAAAMLGGALVLARPTFLKTRFGVDEVVTTLLLNFIVLLFVSFFSKARSRTPWGSAGRNRVRSFAEAQIAEAHPGKRLHFGFIIAIAAAFVVWMIDRRSALGYEMRAVGHNPQGGPLRRRPGRCACSARRRCYRADWPGSPGCRKSRA